MGNKKFGGAGLHQAFGGYEAEGVRLGSFAQIALMDADGRAGGGIGDYGEDFYMRCVWKAAVDADWDLAAAAEIGEAGAFGGDGVMRVGVVEEAEGGDGDGVAETSFNAERALAGGWAELTGFEALANPLGAFEAVETGGGEEDGVDLAFR